VQIKGSLGERYFYKIQYIFSKIKNNDYVNYGYDLSREDEAVREI